MQMCRGRLFAGATPQASSLAVSTGTAVGATHALNVSWYEDPVDMDTSGFAAASNSPQSVGTLDFQFKRPCIVADMMAARGSDARTQALPG